MNNNNTIEKIRQTKQEKKQHEKQILYSILEDEKNEVLPLIVRHGLNITDFTDENYKLIYRYCLEMYNRGESVSIVTLCEKINSKQIEALSISNITNLVIDCVSLDIKRVIEIVKVLKKASLNNNTVAMLEDLAEQIKYKDLDEKKQVEYLEGIRTVINWNLSSENYYIQATEIKDEPKTNIIIPSGIPYIDKNIGGLRGGTLTIISGDSGTGKSTLVDNIISNSLYTNHKTALYSGELANHEALKRLIHTIADEADIVENVEEFTRRKYYRVKEEAQRAIKKWLNKKGFFIVNSEEKTTLAKQLNAIENLKKEKGVQLFIIDNLMKLTLEGVGQLNEYEAQGKTINALKDIATRLNIAVVVVTHNRKNKENKSPSQYNVEGSHKVVSLSDTVISLQATTKNVGVAISNAKEEDKATEITITKSRLNGSKDTTTIYYRPSRRRFFEFPFMVSKSYNYLEKYEQIKTEI